METLTERLARYAANQQAWDRLIWVELRKVRARLNGEDLKVEPITVKPKWPKEWDRDGNTPDLYKEG